MERLLSPVAYGLPVELVSRIFRLAKVAKHLQAGGMLQQTGEAKVVPELCLQLLFPLQKS